MLGQLLEELALASQLKATRAGPFDQLPNQSVVQKIHDSSSGWATSTTSVQAVTSLTTMNVLEVTVRWDRLSIPLHRMSHLDLAVLVTASRPQPSRGGSRPPGPPHRADAGPLRVLAVPPSCDWTRGGETMTQVRLYRLPILSRTDFPQFTPSVCVAAKSGSS